MHRDEQMSNNSSNQTDRSSSNKKDEKLSVLLHGPLYIHLRTCVVNIVCTIHIYLYAHIEVHVSSVSAILMEISQRVEILKKKS